MLSKYSFSTALLALVATTFANTGVVNPSNELICANKNSDVVSAIDLFCVNRGIVSSTTKPSDPMFDAC